MSLNPPAIDESIQTLIRLAFAEDLPAGDRTVEVSIPADLRSRAKIVARKRGVLAGAFLLPAIMKAIPGGGGDISLDIQTADGTMMSPGQTIATLQGPARALLTVERTLLNFLTVLSGVASLTNQYVEVVAAAVLASAHRPQVCDTRKTLPGYRALEKYAVRCGGGVNHRLNLSDGVMLKDNHLEALRKKLGEGLTLAQLTAHIRKQLPPAITLWLEVDTLAQLSEALGGQEPGADIILLDNFTEDLLRQAVAMRTALKRTHVLLEASGGITLQNIAAIARTGIDRISIGAITHSAPALDISMEFTSEA
jgi:nicotinate-nucleotide pyrophosphorylase (carboxylating)